MFDFLQGVGRRVGDWLGHGPNTSDAATAAPGEGPAAESQRPAGLFGRIGQTIGDLGRGLSQEGLGGLLDPMGMLDRQQAQRELSNRFQVVGPDFEGPRNHNQVSQEEYQEIARTYSNIRMGRGDFTMDTGNMAPEQAQQWRNGMMNSVADMMMTTAGRRQVMGISNNVLLGDDGKPRLDADGNQIHRHTTMRPDIADDGSLVTDNAGVGVANGMNDDDKFLRYDADGNVTGRGMGTDANLFINPNLQVDGCNRTDVILAHEMQHVQNRTQGTMVRGTHNEENGEGDAGTNRRERQAVGLPNNAPSGGHYPGDSDGCTENTYREQRNQINPNERLLPRTAYDAWLPGSAGTNQENEEAWRRYHQNNPNAR